MMIHKPRRLLLFRVAAIAVTIFPALNSPVIACNAKERTIPAELTEQFSAALRDIQSTISDRLAACSLSVVLLDKSNYTNVPASDLEILQFSKEAYRLEIGDDAVTISSIAPVGALYGLTDLQNRLHGGKLTTDTILETPALPTRALHFIMRGTTSTEFKELVVQARRARMNTLIIQIADAVAFESFPGHTRKDAMLLPEFRKLLSFARENGLSVIPELKFLTHQEKFLQDKHPELMFNKVTYDPGRQEVYALIQRYLEEIIEVMKPAAIHIGHDEVKGFGRAAREKWLESGEVPLPADLYLQDVLKLHELIAGKGLQVVIWGDMLWEKEAVREIHHRSWAARKDYPSVLQKLPKDIVVVDWRYFDKGPTYPSTDRFISAGFDVYGATWDDLAVVRAFSAFLSSRGVKGRGMIATTWSQLRRGQWIEIHSIISESGKAFWNGG